MKNVHPKVKAGGFAGSLSFLIVVTLSLLGVEFPAGTESALTVVIATAAGYLKSA